MDSDSVRILFVHWDEFFISKSVYLTVCLVDRSNRWIKDHKYSSASSVTGKCLSGESRFTTLAFAGCETACGVMAFWFVRRYHWLNSVLRQSPRPAKSRTGQCLPVLPVFSILLRIAWAIMALYMWHRGGVSHPPIRERVPDIRCYSMGE
jgi:hypothetical protein